MVQDKRSVQRLSPERLEAWKKFGLRGYDLCAYTLRRLNNFDSAVYDKGLDQFFESYEAKREHTMQKMVYDWLDRLLRLMGLGAKNSFKIFNLDNGGNMQQYYAVSTSATGFFTRGALPKTTNFLLKKNRMQRLLIAIGSGSGGFRSAMDHVLCEFIDYWEPTARLYYEKCESPLCEKLSSSDLFQLDQQLLDDVLEYFPRRPRFIPRSGSNTGARSNRTKYFGNKIK